MSNKSSHWPKAVIFSDFNSLAKKLVSEFVSSNCRVFVVSDDAVRWRKHYFENKDIFSISQRREVDLSGGFDYVVLIDLGHKGGEDATGSLDKELSFAKSLSKKDKAKALFVFPLRGTQHLSRERQSILNDKELVSMIVYVGDLLTKEEGFEKDSALNRLMNEALSKRKVEISQNELYYPVNPERVARELVKNLFSFGFSEKEIAIISKPVSAEKLKREIKKKKPKANFLLTDKESERAEAQIKRKKYLKFDLSEAIESLSKNKKTDVTRKFQKIVLVRKEKSQTTKTTRGKAHKKDLIFSNLKMQIGSEKKKHFPPKKKTVLVLSMFGVLVIAPIFVLVASFYSLSFSKEAYLKGNLGKSRNYLAFSKVSSRLLGEYFSLFSRTPVLKSIYSPLENDSLLINKTSDAGQTVLKITSDVLGLSNKILDDEPYDVGFYANRISLDLDYLYKQLGFLESELLELDKTSIFYKKRKAETDIIKNTRESLLLYKKIAVELPSLLGSKNPKAYLVLLQNEQKLRPTGGQIAAFSVVSFNQGKKTGVSISDPDLADQSLPGHVEPPSPIKRYFQKEEWSFKESNWDADFSVSSQKAAWFLEKELAQSVAGVLAIDFSLIESLFGENVLLTDGFEELKDASDLDGVLGDSVGNPPIFLEKLAKQVASLDERQKIKLAIALYKAFNEKHAQLFLNNSKIQRPFSELGFAGEVQKLSCSIENCYSDLLGLVEANFSNSFSNSELKRGVEAKVSFEEGLVKRSLLVIYKNLSGTRGGEGDLYRTYLRVLANGDSGFEPVRINTGAFATSEVAEVSGVRGHKEAGIYVEVAPGETKTLVFSWESASPVEFSSDGEYLLTIRKQAGTNKDIMKSSVSLPENLEILSNEVASLTQGNTLIYNTELLRDFDARIFWKGKVK